MRPELWLLLLLAGAAAAAAADDGSYRFGGHTKLRFVGTSFPSGSLLRELAGSRSLDLEGDLRLTFDAAPGRWTFDADYQLIGLYGDRVEYTRDLPPDVGLFVPRPPADARRLFDFTMHDRDKSALLHRLDRFWAGYASEKTVIRVGRQAISWGNGLFYAPMDLVNPFDPAAIDTEYKAGDDMLYVQYLQDNGNDVQGAVVARRNPLDGEVEREQATAAAKYHGFAGAAEYDLLVAEHEVAAFAAAVAEHYDDVVVGLGGTYSLGGAVLRGDLVVTDTDTDTYTQLVVNWSYSWIGHGRNMSGALEYYFNGFGQHDGRYDTQSLAGNPDLLARVVRGETFTLGRHYLAGSVLVEMTPLWTVTPTLLANIADPSALLQLVTSFSLSDNMTFLGSLNVPLGRNGSEFGGIESSSGEYLASGPGVFAQFAWYF